MSLQSDLDQLARAHGSSALAAAFGALQSAIRRARKKATQQWGTLAKTMLAAMEIWDSEKADGVPQETRVAHLEQTLRAAWPQTREWKFLCQNCSDTGLKMAICPGDATCGRHREHGLHNYGTPCWCDAGKRFRPKPTTSDDELATVGKVGKSGSRYSR